MLVLHLQGDGLHKNSVLGPGLEVLNVDARVDVFVLGEIHVHHEPTVGPAAIPAVEICDVLERPGKEIRQ